MTRLNVSFLLEKFSHSDQTVILTVVLGWEIPHRELDSVRG